MPDNKLKFQNKERLFFTGDTHFFHNGCRVACNRPFADIDEMNEAMVAAWNSNVTDRDTVIHVGDVSFGRPQPSKELLARLRGHIVLVRGNHDHTDQLKRFGDRFERVVDILRLTVIDDDNRYIVACHYPLMTWDKAHYGSWHVHGHSHGSLADDGRNRRIDVGWDVWRQPISYERLKREMDCRGYVPVDHHGEDK